MSIVSFFKSKPFRFHLLYAIAAVILLLWLSLKALDFYTMHGRTISVPDLVGLNKEQAERVLRRANLRSVINDSIFDSDRERGSVAAQNPSSGISVKKNRTVYLTTIAILPEMIAMPDLTDLSLRQALAVLETYGLKAGRLEYVPNIALNAVIQQKFNRATIEAGTLIEKGTAIDLVLGDGAGRADNQVFVPLLIGKSREEAIQLLNSSALNLGQEIYLDEDEEDLRVYRQSPSVQQFRVRVSPGTSVDLYYRSAASFDFDTYMEENLAVATPDLTGKTPEEVFQILQESFLVLDGEVYEFNVPANRARVYRQEPDVVETPRVIRGTRFNIWYRKIEDFDRD